MWRVSAMMRLLGLAAYAVGLALVYTVWGILILCGLTLAAIFRLVGMSLVGLEHAVATHRRWWDSALRAVPGSSARQAARQARERRRTAGAGDPIDVRRTTVEDSLDGSPR